MKKRGQFYLSAAVILVVILVGILIITNSSYRSEHKELQNLQKELNTEIEKTFEYTTYNNLDDDTTRKTLKNLSEIYINKTGIKKNSLFIIGDQEVLILKGNRIENSGEFLINRGIGFENITTSIGIFEKEFNENNANFTIKDDENLYFFELLGGQSFYYLISNNISEEKEVIRN